MILDLMAAATATVTRPRRGQVDGPATTVLNLSRCSLRLVRLEDADPEDTLPALGSTVPWGEEVAFRVVPRRGRDRTVVAHFDVDDADGHEIAERYVVAIGTRRICGSGRGIGAATTLFASPLTHVHLARDYIVLRDAVRSEAVPA